MWAVMTVVVVFEFSVGATLGKGINRGIATLLGGALGVGAHRLANLFGSETLKSILIGTYVFIFASIVTFIRFFHKFKARYDYGLLIFNLTFCLITVSGYRDDEVLEMAITRLTTILIGGIATVITSIVIFPVWAGSDILHDMVSDNIEKLGIFLQGFGEEFFKKSGERNLKCKIKELEKYKSVMNSKATEDSLVNFAMWEPKHGPFLHRHPWKLYQKVSNLARECAYRLDSLNEYLKTELQISDELRAKSAADNLKLLLKTNSIQGDNILEMIPMATTASLLIQVVSFTVKIAESVEELATEAKFNLVVEESSTQEHIEKLKKLPSMDSHTTSILNE